MVEHSSGIYAPGMRHRAVVNAVIGALVVLAAFLADAGGNLFWLNMGVGLVVIVLSALSWWAAKANRPEHALWPALLNVLLGFALMVYPFAFTVEVEREVSFVAVTASLGAVLALLAMYNLWAATSARREIDVRKRFA